MELFEQATRQKVRFSTAKGALTVEDLWDLPLRGADVTLDTVAKSVNARLKAEQEESFVVPAQSAQRTRLALQLDLVKHIIAVKLREEQERLASAGRKAEKDRLIAILDKKQEESMMGMTADQIKARIAELERT